MAIDNVFDKKIENFKICRFLLFSTIFAFKWSAIEARTFAGPVVVFIERFYPFLFRSQYEVFTPAR